MELDKKRDLTKMPILQALIFLAIPIIGANILQIGYQLIDSFWVGRFSEEGLAVMTLGGNIMFLIVSLGSGFAIAGSILVAQFFGAKNHKMVNHIAAQSMVSVFMIGIILSIFGYFFSPMIINFMGAEEQLYKESLMFVRILFIGMTFNYLFFMFQAIIRGVGEVKLPIYIAILSLLINFALAPVLVAGHGPFPAMGANGAGIITLISQAIACSIGLFVLFSGKFGIKIKWSDLKPDFKIIKENFQLGLPASIEMMSRSLAFTIVTGIVTTIGAKYSMQTELLDAYGIGGMIIQITVFVSIGLSMASTVLVGQHAGAGHHHKAKQTAYTATIASFFMMSALGILIYIFVPNIINIFVPDAPKINELGTQMVRTSALFLGLLGIQMSLMGAMRAIGKTQIPMFITILGAWFIKIPFIYFFSKYVILGLDLGIKAIWISEPIQMIVITIIVFFVIGKINWHNTNIAKHEELIN